MDKTEATHILQTLKDSTARYFGKDAFFVAGISGGPDSMALLYTLYKLSVNVLAVHINYGTRGVESDKDQELVEQMSFQWGFECCTIQSEALDIEDSNFQNRARKERYRVFRDLREACGADAIVTAHHKDDQVETILQKVLRGSSPVAWQGMKAWDEELFRPLLSFTKDDILEYCQEHAIPFRTDESNLKPDYARNFIRHNLEEELNAFFPGWKQNILNLREQGEWFESSIAWISSQVSSQFTIYIDKYSSLPEKLKPAVLKYLMDQLAPDESWSKAQLKDLAGLEDLQTGKSLEAGPLEFIRNRDEIILQKKEGVQTVNRSLESIELQNAPELYGVRLKLEEGEVPGENLYIDADKIDWPVQLRTWKAGDRFIPLGMEGTQKVAEHLTNRKIASHLKEKTLVLCGSGGTIYAIIYPGRDAAGQDGAISELMKCDAHSTTFLTIKNTDYR